MAADRVVRLKIVKGINLAKKDIFGASDPYVRVSLVDQNTGYEVYIGKTKTQKKTLNPVWHEEFVFEASNGQKVVLETFDENRITRDDFLGLIEIPVECIQSDDDGNLPSKDYLLHPRSARSRVKGYMRLKIGFVNTELADDDEYVQFSMEEAGNEGYDEIIEQNRARTIGELLDDIVLEPAGNRDVSESGNNNGEEESGYDAQSESSFTAGPTIAAEVNSDSNENANTSDNTENANTSENTENANTSDSTENTDVLSNIATSVSQSSIGNMNSDEADGFRRPPARAPRQQSLRGTHRDRTDSLSSHVSIATMSNEEPLACGWEARTDNTGRTFYVDHINHRTQWERPSRTNAMDLPAGWEERQDYNGRTYYVNHITRVTQWQRPTGASAEPADTETREQQTADVASMYRNRRHISQEDTVEPSGTPTTPTTPVVVETPSETDPQATTEEEPLPPGWAMAQTPSGRTFFIDHNTRATTWHDPRTQNRADDRGLEVPDKPVSRASSNEDLLKDLGPLPAGWEERVHTDGRIFYVNHMTRNTQWEDPRLEKFGGPAVPYSRDYKRKYDYFRSKLRKPSNVPNKIDIKVRRSNILEDSFNVITNVKRPDMLKTRLWIEFEGETGLDYGGVAREWFYLLSKEAFNPYYGLFEYSATDDYTLQINPNSGLANEYHLQYFKFIGRVAGMAVFHGKLLDGFFIRPFYKMMLGKPIHLRDMESVDSEYYNSLVWILENDPECLELTFSVDEEYFGETVERELVPDGKNMDVTDRNKRQYIDLIIKWRFIERVRKQMMALMDGFNDIIPHELIQIFDENELELLMCGLQDIDVNDWKTHTVYKGEYNPNHPVIINFWRACYSFNNELRSRLLQFVTGTSRVPMNGFRELHGSNGPQLFTIEKWGKPSQLPRAHTCFNRLDLPPYTCYEDLRKRLITAVDSAEGFEGVD